jgi:hypothetical protein
MPKRSSKIQTDQPKQENAEQTESESADMPASADTASMTGKNPAAVALGRLGGKKGGKARAEKLTAQQRREIAKKAAAARWRKRKRD